jgi:hypothetical protein
MRRFLILVILLCGCVGAIASPPPNLPQNSASSNTQAVLPSSFSSNGATWTSGSPVIISQAAPQELDKFAPQGLDNLAPVLAEYGFDSAEQDQYQSGNDSLLVRVYHMKDPTGGYGLYSFLREPDMAKADFGEHSSISNNRALVLVGNLVVDITTHFSSGDLLRQQADLKPLLAQVSPRAETGPYPLLWETLPLQDLVPRSDKYVIGPQTLHELLPIENGDWLGFSNGTEAELAQYKVGGRDLTLLVADFPTPQMAAKKLVELDKQFAGQVGPEGHPEIYTRRVLTMIAIVTNARSHAEANTVLDRVHSNLTVTWDEPTFSLTDPNIGTIVVGIIVGTGVLCLFAIIAGLAFGGVRLAVKRLLPGKVFDRAEDLQILQLGIASKPIDSDDFYGLGRTRKR